MQPRFERRSNSVAAVLAVTLLLVVAPAAGPAVAVADQPGPAVAVADQPDPAVAVADQPPSAAAATTQADQPVEIDSCRTISSAGSYVLVANLTDVQRDACIRIAADDVALDGSGHTVDGTGTGAGVGVLLAPTGSGDLRNVTVRDLRATDWRTGVGVQRLADGDLRDVTAAGNAFGFELRATNETRLVDPVAAGNDASGVRVVESANTTVQNASVRENGGHGLLFDTSTVVTIRALLATGNDGPGVELRGVDDAVLDGATVAGNGRAGVLLDDSQRVTVGDGRFRENAAGVRVDGSSEVVVQTSRLVGNDDAGVSLDGRSVNASIRLNAVLDNRVGVRLGSDVRVDTVVVAGNVLSGNDRAGVLNQAPAVVDARRNDWGATDGPSSAPATDPDAPFADPNTSRLANGSGDAVSEHPAEPGVSNVRFDPLASRQAPSPFQSPLEARVGNTTFVVGPPRDLDGNGTYEDVTGDGSFDGQDVAALQVLLRAFEAGGLSLSQEQVAALDFDGDGEFGAGDVEALAEEVG